MKLVLSALVLLFVISDGPTLPKDQLPEDLFHQPLPMGLPEPPRSYTEAQFDLGRALFFDPVLSVDRSTACAS